VRWGDMEIRREISRIKSSLQKKRGGEWSLSRRWSGYHEAGDVATHQAIIGCHEPIRSSLSGLKRVSKGLVKQDWDEADGG